LSQEQVIIKGSEHKEIYKLFLCQRASTPLTSWSCRNSYLIKAVDSISLIDE